MRRTAAAVVLTIFLLFPVLSVSGCTKTPDDAYRDAGTAYEREDYQTAYRLLKPLAESGRADAQFAIGNMYYRGKGVSQDYTEAMRWFRKAAEQNLAVAQHYLGEMYYEGKGVPQDFGQADMWNRRAAEQGYVLAQGLRGDMYFSGKGLPKDYILAHMWYSLSISRFPPEWKALQKATERARDLVASMMTPDQIAEAQKLAREWKPKMER
jgi:hypothetical protein